MSTEQQKFETWFNQKKENGMLDFKVSLKKPLPEGTTLEDVYRELNQLIVLEQLGELSKLIVVDF
jgi:hypothetical protein